MKTLVVILTRNTNKSNHTAHNTNPNQSDSNNVISDEVGAEELNPIRSRFNFLVVSIPELLISLLVSV